MGQYNWGEHSNYYRFGSNHLDNIGYNQCSQTSKEGAKLDWMLKLSYRYLLN